MRTEIERVVVGLREQYSENLTLDNLAEMARLSPFHMARLFCEETGLPPGGFRTAVRMEAARSKLLRTNATVTDICFQVGYNSLGAFTNRFIKTVGLSPGRYRRLAELGDATVDLMACDRDLPFTYGGIRLRVSRFDGWDDEPVYAAVFPFDPACRAQARCRRLNGTRWTQQLSYIPAGRWLVRAVSAGPCTSAGSIVTACSPALRVGVGEVVDIVLKLTPGWCGAAPLEIPLEYGRALPEMFRV